jgi:hypothetical protein
VKARLLVVLFALGSIPAPARAEVTISLDPMAQAYADAFGLTLAELQTAIQAEVENVFNIVEPQKYLRAFADAEAFSSKGLGVDYASSPTFASIGFAVNATLAVGEEGFSRQTESERPVVGVAPNLAITAGVNLGTITGGLLEGFTVYANGFHREGRYYKDFNIGVTSFGAHVQYKLFKGNDVGKLIVAWNGLDITTGFEYGKLKVTLRDDLPSELDLSQHVNVPDVRVLLTSVGRYQLTTSTYAVPIEVTTGVRLLYLLTLYGGLGFDLIHGNSGMDVSLDGTFMGELPDGPPIPLGSGRIQATESGKPSAGRLRFLAGLQANLWAIKLFAQGNLAPDSTVGVTAGLRFAW